MFALPQSWLAFVVALVVTQVLGFLWYSLTLFGKPWMKAIGKTEKQLRAQAKPTDYIYTVVGAALMLIVLGNVLTLAGATNLVGAANVAFALWVAFTAAGNAMTSVFEGRSWTLFYINNGYHLVNMVVAAVILTLL